MIHVDIEFIVTQHFFKCGDQKEESLKMMRKEKNIWVNGVFTHDKISGYFRYYA